MKKLALLNSTVLTSNGIFSLKDISLEKARERTISFSFKIKWKSSRKYNFN